jgi:hypothetical protein
VEEKTNKSVNDLLKTAKDRFRLASESESEIRKLALEDLEFRSGKQWPDEVKRDRELERRPCLTINRIPQFIRQVTNDQRQNRPSIKVNPVDDKADIETAKVLQGIIRHIEYNSNADIAYDSAFSSAVTHGFGYFRIITDYLSDDSFEQEILIKRIVNPFSVYFDPNHTEPDGSDAEWAFVFDVLSEEEFKQNYPKAKLSQMDDWRALGDGDGWVDRDTVRVAEYFYKEYEEIELVQMKDGTVFKATEIPQDVPQEFIKSKRKANVPSVKWCKTNGIEILEETKWLGTYIPIVPVLGDEINVNGKKILEGIVRHAKDPQRMYNYWATSETEQIALAPKVPYIGAEGQFEGHEAKWKTANVKNHAYLEYKQKSFNGQMAPPPQRNVYEPAVQAITNARMQSSEDLKATTGIYDAALGARSNENSGVAIQRRNNQSQTANFHFVDNLSRAIRHTGRIIVDLIPKIYDSSRAVRIIGENDEQQIVLINQVFEDGGKLVEHKLSYGKYDVAISNGPSYATKRQEALASMLDLTRAYPQVAQFAGDLMIKNMDWPGADEIAERIKKTIPPDITMSEKDKQSIQIPPQVQQQLQQMGQMIEQLTKQLHGAQDQIEQKEREIQSKERIELAKIEAGMREKLIDVAAKDYLKSFEAEIAQLDQRQKQLEAETPFESESYESAEGMSPLMPQNPNNGVMQ